jgi:hypothetical protein
MSELEVACAPSGSGWLCEVGIGPDAGATRHVVGVSADDLRRLAAGAVDPTALVEASFQFLLEREPRESILGAFDLPVIGRYFPEWESQMRARHGG